MGYGMTVPFDGIPLAEHQEWFEQLVEHGYSDVWSSESDGTDGFTPLALAAAWMPSSAEVTIATSSPGEIRNWLTSRRAAPMTRRFHVWRVAVRGVARR